MNATAGDEEQAELERLQAEVAELRSAAAGASTPAGSARGGGRWTGRGRWVVTGVLVVLVAVLTPATVVARYARGNVLDTDRYVSTVAPLARHPDVQEAVADEITDQVLVQLEVEDVLARALEALAERGVPERVVGLVPPITDQVESFVRERVLAVVRSERFAEIWEDAHRVAHDQVNALLTGEDPGALEVEEGMVSLDLGVLVAEVRRGLLDRGFELAERIPDVEREFLLVESANLESGQRGVRLLDRVATWLPFLVLGLAVGAVLVAPDRRRGLLAVSLGAAAGLVLLAGGLVLARNWYIDHGQPQTMSLDAALGVAQTVLAPLRTTLRAALALALVVAAAAFLVGPSRPARAVRRAVTGGVGAVRERAAGDRPASAVEAWVAANKTALRVGIVAAGAVVFALWTYPTGAVVLAIVGAIVLGLVLVELVGRAPA
ncbi:MAG TPA: hypothetical protein VE575_02385 [Acidimicrobiales bacterium]|nr:hypothetical protein [Acidimicrobiales bacterium]